MSELKTHTLQKIRKEIRKVSGGFRRLRRLDLPPQTIAAACNLLLFDLHAIGLDGVDGMVSFSK